MKDLLHFGKPEVLGLDIGGANLKAATTSGRAIAEPFPLWRDPAGLTDRLKGLMARLEPFDSIAATMTGELADCYPTKAEGVSSIVASIESAANGAPLALWSTEGRFVSADAARAEPLQLAAANWLALAAWVGRLVPRGRTLLLDIGSTTTDLIPLRDGIPAARGRTDLGRLLSRELVYTGVRRTPLCATASHVSLRGASVRPAAELFATTLDPLLLLGEIAEQPDDRDTADGRPATRLAAGERLARCLCCDQGELTADELQDLARQFVAAQVTELGQAIQTLADREGGEFEQVLVSGSGGFLGRKIAQSHPATHAARKIDLGRLVSPAVAATAPACAVAVLWSEQRCREERSTGLGAGNI